MKRFVLLISLLSVPVWADVVTLKDGTRLEGDLKRTAEGWTIRLSDGKTRSFRTDDLKSIQAGSSGPRDPLQAAAGLASLRRSVEALSDLDEIISRYRRFIDSTKDQALIAEAQADLEAWRDKKAKGLIKHGSQWVSPAQVDELSIAATVQALQSRDLIRQNKLREADQLLQQALAGDPKNLSVLYLRGVTAYRQDRLVDARRAFEAVVAQIPEHVPSLNNLAVISWRQNQQAAALNFYDQAMQAAGINEYILNNAAEALGAIPEEQRRATSYSRAVRRFAEQDQMLQQQKAQQGLYRWGSSWVDEKRLDELKNSEREIRQKLDAMQLEYNQAAARVNAIAGEISTNENSMTGMRINTGIRDTSGSLVMIGPPQAYYDLQRQNATLVAEQQALAAKMTTLNEQATRLRSELPAPHFTGIQQLIGVEGMPGAEPVPSTQPLRERP